MSDGADTVSMVEADVRSALNRLAWTVDKMKARELTPHQREALDELEAVADELVWAVQALDNAMEGEK